MRPKEMAEVHVGTFPVRLAGRQRRQTILLLLGVLVAVLLFPIWAVRYPPFIDYPNLLARTFVLAHLTDANFHFSQFYGAVWGPYPYLALDGILVGLQRLVSVEIAGRILLSICVLGVPLSAWFFLREASPGEDYLAFWPLLLSYNTFFIFGFINFELSLALCFLALGLWLRYLARPGLWRWCLAALVVTALYFSHLMGFGVAGLVALSYCILARRSLKEVMLSGLLFLPGCLCYLYLLANSAEQGSGPPELLFRSLKEKIIGLSAIMRGYSTPLDLATLILLAVCVVAAAWPNPELRWNRPWLWIALEFCLLYWAFPMAYSAGWDADRRLLLFIFVLVLAAVKIGKRARSLAIVALLLFAVRTADVCKHFISVQKESTALARSFTVTPAYARVLPVIELRQARQIERTYLHFWAYGVIRNQWFCPYLFAAKGVQPLRIAYEAYSPREFERFTASEPLDRKRVQTDYDYIWAYNAAKSTEDLSSIGLLVFQEGRLRVYRIKKSSQP